MAIFDYYKDLYVTSVLVSLAKHDSSFEQIPCKAFKPFWVESNTKLRVVKGRYENVINFRNLVTAGSCQDFSQQLITWIHIVELQKHNFIS